MYSRFAKTRIQESLTDTRVVLIAGPRQSGKTTLAEDIATADTPFLTLDDATVLQSALDDPVGFIRGLDRAVVDEIQRAPDLLLSIKKSVDENTTPGRFLLTGSANLMTIPSVADSLGVEWKSYVCYHSHKLSFLGIAQILSAERSLQKSLLQITSLLEID